MNTLYPPCGICKIGHLIPVNLGEEGINAVIYMCTNPRCNVRFDQHGYERFDPENQEWRRISGE